MRWVFAAVATTVGTEAVNRQPVLNAEKNFRQERIHGPAANFARQYVLVSTTEKYDEHLLVWRVVTPIDGTKRMACARLAH